MTSLRDELDWAFDHYDEREAAEFAALIQRRQATVRCDDCGYLLNAIGHKIACEATS